MGARPQRRAPISLPFRKATAYMLGMNDTPENTPNSNDYGASSIKVLKGLDVVDAIAGVPTGMSKGMQDVPTSAVVITTIRRVK